MLHRRGQTGQHEFGVLSRIPDHERKNIYCQKCIDKYRELICGIFTLFVLIVLHWNFSVESKFNRFHIFTCSSSDNNHICSLIYGCFENILFASILIGIYYVFFYFYFRMRYHFPLSDLLSGIDAYIISLPWLLSPLLKYHSITSLIIDSSQLFDSLFVYQYPLEIESDDNIISRSLLQIINNTNSTNIISMESTSISPSISMSYELAPYHVLVAAFIRTLWSFILWNGLDHYLWSNKCLIWLFESGPNRAIISLKSEHQRMVYNILLPHFSYIADITRLCIEFVDDEAPFILLDIKNSIFQSLKHNNLSDSYKWFSVITAVMSSYRLWYCPSIGYLFAPIFFVIGIIVILIIVILAILNGDPSGINCDSSFCNYQFFIVFGVFGAALCWGIFIWWSMQKRLKVLKDIQENALLNNSFQYRLARTVYSI